MTNSRKMWAWPPILDCFECRRAYYANCEECGGSCIDPMPWSEVMNFGRDPSAMLAWYQEEKE